MKKYFAKWLPVEGEIKEGDKVRHNGKIVTALKKEGEGDTWKTDGFPTYGSNLQKVKLFLCSRDIQVGDTYFWEGNKYICDSTIHLGALMAIENVHPLDRYKVIGEISPEATWVTEGMEFDENEVEITTPFSVLLEKYLPIRVKILGPCKHFH